MLVYNIIFLSLFLFSLLQIDKRIKYFHIFIIFILIFMVTILGLRYGIGNDYFSYKRIFDEIYDPLLFDIFIYRLNESTPVESGFAGVIFITKLFTNSYFLFVFFWAILSISIKYYVFRRISPYIGLSFLIYFSDEWFWKDLSGSRVGMASALILLSVIYAYRRSFFKFIVIILLAVLFHSSAIIGIGIYFIRYFSSKKLMYLAIAMSTLIAIFGGMGIALSEFISSFLELESSSRVIKYIDSKYVGDGGFFRGTNILHLVLSLVFIYYYTSLIKKWKYNHLLVPMYIYGTVLMFIFVDYEIFWGRIREMITIPALAIVLPSMVFLFKGKQKMIGFILVIFYCLMMYYLMIKDRVPYQSIFSL